MIEWNEQRLEELVRKIGLRRAPGQGKTPIPLSLYSTPGRPMPLLTRIMRFDATEWSALGYDETDRVSGIRYLGSLGCRTEGALSAAARWQQPLTLDLAKLLVDAGARDEKALSYAVCNQHPLNLELAKLLIDAGAYDEKVLWYAARWQRPLILELTKVLTGTGCDPAAQDGYGWDALVYLAAGGHPMNPQVTDLFLSAGCRTDLDGCDGISGEQRLRFDQILKEHTEWKEQRDRLVAENSPADTSYGPDWGW